MTYHVAAGRIQFTADRTGQCGFGAPGLPLRSTRGGDFWRVYLDDADFMEIPVYSRMQRGRVAVASDGLEISYGRLLTATGVWYDVALQVSVSRLSDRLTFGFRVENRDERVRVNEVQCPLLDMEWLCGPREQDVLYLPQDMGRRVANPWEQLARYSTEHRAKDQAALWGHLTYPGRASMGWMGVETGGCFLYVGRHDPQMRTCLMSFGRGPLRSDPRLTLTYAHFPALRKGESEVLPPTVVALLPGDWRNGSSLYRSWADDTFYRPSQPPAWVRRMTGWQRIIMKHQYGEILYRYDDLPELYRQGMKAGIDTLLVFGWWKGRFDNAYPHYEPDDKMGGAPRLAQAIKDVQALGGRVILYSNGASIDLKSDFYREHHAEACQLDVDGNEYRREYRFSGEGLMLKAFGYKSFATACMASAEWKERLVDQGRLMLDFAPDSIFFDQIGGFPDGLCFNADHAHGKRVDRDWTYRLRVYAALRELARGETALGTEWVNDIAGTQADYIHNLDSVKPGPESFPQLFRHTFPEIITTNRMVQEEYPGYERDLTYAFLMGVRNCVSIYRCRGHLGLMPDYTRRLRRLTELRRRYEDYMVFGRFTCRSNDVLPAGWERAEYVHRDGTRLLRILWNGADRPRPLPDGREGQVDPGELDFQEITL